MKTTKGKTQNGKKCFLLMVAVTILLGWEFRILHNNQQKYFDEINERYEKQETVNLDDDLVPEILAKLLVNGNYIPDYKSAIFIVNHIKAKGELIKEELPNLGALNKRDFHIPVSQIDLLDDEHQYLKERVEASRKNILINDIPEDAPTTGLQNITFFKRIHSAFLSLLIPSYSLTAPDEITVKIVHDEEKTKDQAPLMEKIIYRSKQILQGEKNVEEPVTVILREHFYISSEKDDKECATTKERLDTEKPLSFPVRACDVILGYSKTNEKGIARFEGLNESGYYSVLPVKQGFQYGDPKGTTKGSLGSMPPSKRDFTFTQREHAIPPFDFSTYSDIKADNIITARKPENYQEILKSNLILFLVAWWLLYFICHVVRPAVLHIGRRRKEALDWLLLPLMMALSGACLLIMCAIHNPLTDRMLSNEMLKGILWGILLIAILSFIDILAFFNGHYRFLGWLGGLRPIRFDIVRRIVIWISGIWIFLDRLFGISFGKKIKRFVSKLPEGSGYLILALMLTGLLFTPLGGGHSGAKVNLNLIFISFQPGEIAKYLIIIFLAAFFYNNEEKIRKFFGKYECKSLLPLRGVGLRSLKIQLYAIIGVALGIAALLVMYLILGDMGPALVLTITFIVLYSVARGDIPQLIIGVLSFCFVLWVGSRFDYNMIAVVCGWGVLWLLYGFTRPQKRFHESAIFLNMVIIAFIFGGTILNFLHLDTVAERLTERVEISQNIWDNEVQNGVHVAQGLWSLASGGIFGQGLGKGNPNLVPEFHTDMVFTSIGEEIGWCGLFAVVFCMTMLLCRAMSIGKRSGHPFAFYLVAGITIVTGIQFLIITLGSTGVIPLTGVALPFLSYGKVGIIMNLAAFGIVFSISKIKGVEEDVNEINEKYSLMVDTCKYGYAIIVFCLMGVVLLRYQFFERDVTLIRPAMATTASGARYVIYNERITLLMKNLYAGNIYDRNDILLATNDINEIRDNLEKYEKAGVNKIIYENELKERKQRYYPFGKNLFFWLGDYNEEYVLCRDSIGATRGYIAECRHIDHLRGFDDQKSNEDGSVRRFELTSKFKDSPFLYAVEKTFYVPERDYVFLIPYLKDGVNGRMVEEFNKKEEREKRNIKLTVDAALQTKLQNKLEEVFTTSNTFRGDVNSRASIVVLNSETGDVLSSANYPLHDMGELKTTLLDNTTALDELKATVRDLGMTFPTSPGSTVKLMGALAGFKRFGKEMLSKSYVIREDERIRDAPRSAEPHSRNQNDRIGIERAIPESSNVFFIKLVNDTDDLYDQLADIYCATGIGVGGLGINSLPYSFYNMGNGDNSQKHREEMLREDMKRRQAAGTNGYARYQKEGKPKLNDNDVFGLAWGQGPIIATPLAMARVVAAIANNGNLVDTKYVMNPIENLPRQNEHEIISTEYAKEMQKLMRMETGRRSHRVSASVGFGGKSGTPQRVVEKSRREDSWYIFFINKPEKPGGSERAPLAVAVRIELGQSAFALAAGHIIPLLTEAGY